MNNSEVSQILADCSEELDNISALLVGLGDGANPTPYVKKYAVIKATGAIEIGFKQIIADKVDHECNIQVKNFVTKKVRESSFNPKLGLIESMLSEFDQRWNNKFEELLSLEDKPALKGSLTELVNARNEFAHGGNPDVDIEKTIYYFQNGCKILEILDQVVNYNFDE
jgi:hypothetical protein